MLLTTLTLTGCDGESEWEKQERLAWSAPCKDEATLLATTAGSPSVKKCPNRLHVMQVQVATQASNEEAAALVFCRCERGDAGK
jgi:hypothetical protein